MNSGFEPTIRFHLHSTSLFKLTSLTTLMMTWWHVHRGKRINTGAWSLPQHSIHCCAWEEAILDSASTCVWGRSDGGINNARSRRVGQTYCGGQIQRWCFPSENRGDHQRICQSRQPHSPHEVLLLVLSFSLTIQL